MHQNDSLADGWANPSMASMPLMSHASNAMRAILSPVSADSFLRAASASAATAAASAASLAARASAAARCTRRRSSIAKRLSPTTLLRAGWISVLPISTATERSATTRLEDLPAAEVGESKLRSAVGAEHPLEELLRQSSHGHTIEQVEHPAGPALRDALADPDREVLEAGLCADGEPPV